MNIIFVIVVWIAVWKFSNKDCPTPRALYHRHVHGCTHEWSINRLSPICVGPHSHVLYNWIAKVCTIEPVHCLRFFLLHFIATKIVHFECQTVSATIYARNTLNCHWPYGSSTWYVVEFNFEQLICFFQLILDSVVVAHVAVVFILNTIDWLVSS